MDSTKIDYDLKLNILEKTSQESEIETKAEIDSETLLNEEDYFKGSDLSAGSEKALDELLTKMNKASNKKAKKKYKIINDYSKTDFEIIGFLGKGSFAQVLKARHNKLNEIIALKVVERSFLEKEYKFYQVFLEHEVLRMLDHPNVIKIKGIFEEHDKIYTVLEYCSAGDFREFIMNNCKSTVFKLSSVKI